MKTNFFEFDSENKILPAVAWLPESEPIAVLQITHGMTEHIGRYEAFAGSLFLIYCKILFLHFGNLSLHGLQDFGSAGIARDKAVHVVPLRLASKIVKREIIFKKEASVFYKAKISHKSVFGADGIDRNRVFVFDRVDQRSSLVFIRKNDR